jgi:integrase
MACIAKRRGRYVIDFYDQNGKRRWKTLKANTTKTKAKEELRAIEDAIDKGFFLPKSKVSSFSEVAKEWLKYKKSKVRETTWEVIEGMLRNHFDDLNKQKITRITTATIEKYITAMQEKGVHILTLRKILVTLGQIMDYAVRHRHIGHNPYREAEKPKDQRTQEKEIRVLTPSEIRAFLDAVDDQKYKTLFLTAILTGARQGELLGLKWEDLDLEKKQVYIQRTFNNGRFFPTKTKGSKRKIDLSPTLLTELKKWKLACPKTNEFLKLDLMFPNDAGGPINKNNLINRKFDPALKKAGIERIRFHDIRHSYASLMIEQGENIKYIQTQLGHSSPTVTLNVYAHLMKKTNQEAVMRLEKTIFEEDGSKMVAETKKGLTING